MNKKEIKKSERDVVLRTDIGEKYDEKVHKMRHYSDKRDSYLSLACMFLLFLASNKCLFQKYTYISLGTVFSIRQVLRRDCSYHLDSIGICQTFDQITVRKTRGVSSLQVCAVWP